MGVTWSSITTVDIAAIAVVRELTLSATTGARGKSVTATGKGFTTTGELFEKTKIGSWASWAGGSKLQCGSEERRLGKQWRSRWKPEH